MAKNDADFIRQLSRDVPRELFRDASLFGIEASVPVRFYNRRALWIPRAVSDNPGGRETIYQLPLKESTLLGIYVIDDQIVKEMVTRRSDKSYSLRLETVNGKEIFSGDGDLEVLDDRVGYGKIHFLGERTVWARTLFGIEPGRDNKTSVWIIWSCIKVDHE